MRQAILCTAAMKAACFPHDLYEKRRHSDVELWAVNCQNLREKLPAVSDIDRMFNIHRYELLRRYGYPCYRDAEWCRDHPQTKFYTADRWPDTRMDGARIFPREDIARRFPEARNDYHVNSLDWLIAFALLEEFEAVHLHGWNLARDGIVEQASARPCAEYWAGFAEAKGMKVILGADSDLFHPYHLVRSDRVYGYDDCPAWEDKSRDARFTDVPYRYDDY